MQLMAVGVTAYSAAKSICFSPADTRCRIEITCSSVNLALDVRDPFGVFIKPMR